MNDDQMTDRDKLLLSVLEELPPQLIEVLLKVQEREGVSMGKFVAEVIGHKMDRLTYDERQQVIEHFKKLGIDLEEATEGWVSLGKTTSNAGRPGNNSGEISIASCRSLPNVRSQSLGWRLPRGLVVRHAQGAGSHSRVHACQRLASSALTARSNPGRCIRPRCHARTPFRIESRGCWYTGGFPSSFQLFGFKWQVIRSTPNFVAAKAVYGLRPFTVFRYSSQNEAFVRDFSAPKPVDEFYVSAVGEYTYRSTAIRSLKTLEDQLQSYRKFFRGGRAPH
jgi:hypothetical protein